MSKFNAFRPTICEMENRTLMSANPFSLVAEAPAVQATYDLGTWSKKFHDTRETAELRYELENVIISSFQTTGHAGLTKDGPGTLVLAGDSIDAAAGSSGMSAGKVSYSDLSIMISLERDDVGGSLELASQPRTADHKGEIEIQSWSFGETAPSAAGHKGEIEIASWSFGATNPGAAIEVTKVGTGTLEFHGVQLEAAGSHALYQDVTIPSAAGVEVNPNMDFALSPDDGGTGKAVLFVRKAGGERPTE
jgi:hypothetical protein